MSIFTISDCSPNTIHALAELAVDTRHSQAQYEEATACLMEDMDEDYRSEFFGNHPHTYKVIKALINVLHNSTPDNKDDLVEAMKQIAVDYYYPKIDEFMREPEIDDYRFCDSE